jgi:mannose-6-phosphate isomerase-like protein (cupin superfamily)
VVQVVWPAIAVGLRADDEAPVPQLALGILIVVHGRYHPPMSYEAISFREKFGKFREHFQPKVIAQMNDYQFKLARVEGEFVWHRHGETDEAFIVVEGELTIDFRDGAVTLRAGEMFVVPRGVEHKPSAASECKIMLIEPVGTVNTGEVGGEMTAPNDVWI